jgi:hypothetical protein
MDKFDTSENKVTYLLGAGASVKGLPTVKPTSVSNGLAKALSDFAQMFENDKSVSSSNDEFVKEMVGDLRWLATNSEKFGTTDTFAKFLYLKDRNSLLRLKLALSFYFTVEQFLNDKKDDRALIFLTTVMEYGQVFPRNIKILSWNYDFQIEIAAEVFRKEEYHPAFITAATPPLINYYPGLGNALLNNDVRNITMIHLNGIAGYFFYEPSQTHLSLFFNKPPENINEIIKGITLDKNKKHHLLTFAWEEETDSAIFLNKRIEYATSLVEDTDIFVIIGYSFPYFNRSIDSQIFNALQKSGRLKKIYYQDPARSGDFLKNQFAISKDIEIIPVSDTSNYFVPNEL